MSNIKCDQYAHNSKLSETELVWINKQSDIVNAEFDRDQKYDPKFAFLLTFS